MHINTRKIAAPIVLALLLIVFFHGYRFIQTYIQFSEFWNAIVMALTTIISIVIAQKIWPSSLLTVVLTLIITLFLREFLILVIFISLYAGSNLWEAFLAVIVHPYTWYRILLPFVVGISTFFILKYLIKRLKQ